MHYSPSQLLPFFLLAPSLKKNQHTASSLIDQGSGPYVELVLPARLLAQAMSRSLFSPPAELAHGHELGGVLRYERGTKVLHQTIQYLRERQEFEDEWLASWAESPVPCSLVWGQLDPVATAALGDFLRHGPSTGRPPRATESRRRQPLRWAITRRPSRGHQCGPLTTIIIQ